MRSQRSRGFTLIELMVVILIIAVLMALLLPAVRSSREAARRDQCINNLKQLGIGMHDHHEAHGTFPPGAWNSPSRTWTSYILPYLEQPAMSNALNVNAPWYDPRNSTVTGATIAVFLCPSDPGAGGTLTTTVAGSTTTRRKGNYAANWGNAHFDQGNPNPFNGPNGPVVPQQGAFRVNSATRPPFSMSDYIDGTSNTMMLSELIATLPNGRRVDVRGDIWSASRCAFQYMAYTPPNAKIPDQMDGKNDCAYPFMANPPCSPGTGVLPAFAAARSRHPRGVNVLFADGGVRFVKDSLNLEVWRAYSTRDGGEVVLTHTY